MAEPILELVWRGDNWPEAYSFFGQAGHPAGVHEDAERRQLWLYCGCPGGGRKHAARVDPGGVVRYDPEQRRYWVDRTVTP